MMMSMTSWLMSAGLFATIAATIYFIMERSSMNMAYRRQMTMATVISAMGALFFLDQMTTGAATSTVASAAAALGLGGMAPTTMAMTSTPMTFSTEASTSMMTFGIWAVTLPMITMLITSQSGATTETRQTGTRMTAAAILMALFSFMSAEAATTADGTTTAWIMFAIATACFGYILSQMYGTLTTSAMSQTTAMREGFTTNRTTFTVAMGLFPIMTILTNLGMLSMTSGLATMLMTLATVANFTMYGMTATQAARGSSMEEGSDTVTSIGTTATKTRKAA